MARVKYDVVADGEGPRTQGPRRGRIGMHADPTEIATETGFHELPWLPIEWAALTDAKELSKGRDICENVTCYFHNNLYSNRVRKRDDVATQPRIQSFQTAQLEPRSRTTGTWTNPAVIAWLRAAFRRFVDCFNCRRFLDAITGHSVK